jgi:hypothetical protein
VAKCLASISCAQSVTDHLVPLPRSISGTSYAASWLQLWNAAARTNGSLESDDRSGELADVAGGGEHVPRLSNGQAVAVLQAWRRAAARSKVPWSLWYELMLYAFGWRQDGDRFDDTQAHAKALYPQDWTTALWGATRELAKAIDASHAVVRPLPLDEGMPAYGQAERDAWERMKVERKAAGVPPPPAPSPGAASSPPSSDSGAGASLPDVVVARDVGTAAASSSSSSDDASGSLFDVNIGGGLVLAVIALLLLRDRKRGRR